MLLKEFDLDLPYKKDIIFVNGLISNGLSSEEATKIDYAENWKKRRINFRQETRCVTSMFERLFRRFRSDDAWKILVEVVPTITNNKIRNYSGVCTVEVPYKIVDFELSEDSQKKKISLSLLMEGIGLICDHKNWDITPFLEARDLIIKANYKNEWIWKKPITSPDRKLTAEIICRHEINDMSIYLLIKQSNLKIGEKLIISTKPDEFDYVNYLGKLDWTSMRIITLESKNKKGVIQIDLSELLP